VSTLSISLLFAIASLGPFQFRTAYGSFLNHRIQVPGSWYTTPHALLHILAFVLLGSLASLISRHWTLRVSCLLYVIIEGSLIEWIQFKESPGNPFETSDLSCDVAGALAGAATVYWIALGRTSWKTFSARD
jgi:hypothetical protein